MSELAPFPRFFIDILNDGRKTSAPGAFMAEGRRNNDLTRLAGSIYRMTGADDRELFRMLQSISSEQASPLPENEVASIARSIASYDRSPVDKVDELHLSKVLAGELQGEFCFGLGRGWMWYNGRHWVADVENKRVQERVKVFILSLFEAITSRNSASDGDLLKAIKACLKAAKVNNLIQMASSDPNLILEPERFDAKPDILNVLNGTIEFGSGEIVFRDHQPSDYLTMCANVEYDPKAEAPLFKKLLSFALDEDTGQFLMRYFGYSATGHANQRVYAIFYGKGANGKSTIVNVVQDILGGYAINVETSTFLQARAGQIRTDLAGLKGARLAVSSEFGSGQVMDAPLLKQLVGNDKITARFLFKTEIEYKPTVVPLFVTNALPVINGGDEALAARIIVVPFQKIVPKEDRDPRLPEKLWEERSGILNLLLAGMRDYLSDGKLRRPQSVIDAAEAYVKESDLMGQFIEDRCRLVAEEETGARDLYLEYRFWCIDRGLQPMSMPVFKADFANKTGALQKRSSKGQFWGGVGIKKS
ncbi:phage/plasmid primase, P4 family [uncultured Marivita sp.]|uniref:phage/plasmid primase, P4 family n=1 Tax=uncultured Marivita sp. TaxID=888080 RepID=UPI002638878D|nr:phage/plasmid primase, P4 family [uncultured Marivita sp.]